MSWRPGTHVYETLQTKTKSEAENTHLELIQSESTAGTDLGVISDGGTPNNWAKRTSCRSWGNSFGLLDAVTAAPKFAGWLIEPSFDVALPVLVEVPIRDHIITLTHFETGK